jgi:transcriptional regulator with XRE-family HTH domain
MPQPNPSATRVGIVIREARKARNLSLRELAALAEVDYSMLSRVERGVVDPSPRWLKAVTDALGQHAAKAEA